MGQDAPPLFRARMAWLYAAFFGAIVAGRLAWGAAPGAFEPFAGALSLPRPYLLLVDGAPPAWAPLYLVPAAAAAASYALRAWATAHLSFAVVGDRRIHAERLVVAGPYRHVRNPLYLGLLLLAGAFGLVLPPPTLPLVLLAVGAVLRRLAAVESRRLAAAHPGHALYARHVPALLPRLSPWRSAEGSGRAPDWRDGLVGEGWHLAVVLAFALLATPARPLAPLAGAAALVAWAGLLRARRMPFPAA